MILICKKSYFFCNSKQKCKSADELVILTLVLDVVGLGELATAVLSED